MKNLSIILNPFGTYFLEFGKVEKETDRTTPINLGVEYKTVETALKAAKRFGNKHFSETGYNVWLFKEDWTNELLFTNKN